MQLNFSRFNLICGLALLMVACSPTLASRGVMLDPDRLAEVKEGSTREEVAEKLGTPTVVSTYDDKVWYYIGRKTEQVSFFDPEVKEQQAVEVRFDDQGIVTAVTKLDVSGAYDVATVDKQTPTYGNDNTFIRQLLGNLSRPIPHTGAGRGR